MCDCVSRETEITLRGLFTTSYSKIRRSPCFPRQRVGPRVKSVFGVVCKRLIDKNILGIYGAVRKDALPPSLRYFFPLLFPFCSM